MPTRRRFPSFPVVAFQATVTLPYFSQLAKATTGVSEEVRLYSTQGVTSMQLGPDPQTATAWKPKMEYNGSTQVACNGSAFPQGDVVTEDGGVNSGTFTEDYPDIGIEFYDTAGRYAYCDYYPFGNTQDWFSTPPYSRISFVDGFNVKGFHLPPSPVAATSFSAVSVFDNATSQTLPAGHLPAWQIHRDQHWERRRCRVGETISFEQRWERLLGGTPIRIRISRNPPPAWRKVKVDGFSR